MSLDNLTSILFWKILLKNSMVVDWLELSHLYGRFAVYFDLDEFNWFVATVLILYLRAILAFHGAAPDTQEESIYWNHFFKNHLKITTFV